MHAFPEGNYEGDNYTNYTRVPGNNPEKKTQVELEIQKGF